MREIPDILNQYTIGNNKRYMYRDINYDDRGIDYTRYLKLRLSTFDKEHHFIEEFTPEGFRILWYLMTRAKKSVFITITVNIIVEVLKMTKYKVLKGINALITSEIIIVYSAQNNDLQKVKDVNKPLNIIIKYHDDDLYDLDGQKGYKAIPFDFIHRTVIDLNEKEFTIYMFLILRHRYYGVKESIDETTGKVKHYVNDVNYAFPTQEQISEQISIDRHHINGYIESLEEKGYIRAEKSDKKTYEIDKLTGKAIIKNVNTTYEVNLLNRLEYIKYQIVNVAEKLIEKLPKNLKQYIAKTKCNEILISYDKNNTINNTVKNYIYLNNLYGCGINEYQNKYEKYTGEE